MLLFDFRAQRVFALNPTASYLWLRREEGATAPEELANLLAKEARLDPSDAGRIVDQALAGWEQHGLLDDARAGTTERVAVALAARPRRQRLQPLRRAAGDLRIEAVGLRVRLRWQRGVPAERLKPIIAMWASTRRRRDLCIDILSDEGFSLNEEGVVVQPFSDPEELAPLVKERLTRHVLQGGRYTVALHAALAAKDGAPCLLVAPSGSGKSTLCAGLLRHGWQVATDDAVFFDAREGVGEGLPLAVAVKEGAWKALAPLFPELAALPCHRRGDAVAVKYLPVPGDRPAPVDRIARIVFPKWRAGVGTRLRELDLASGLQRLFTEAFSKSHRLDRRGFLAFVEWLRTARCFELHFSSLSEAIAAMNRLLPAASYPPNIPEKLGN